MFVNEIVGRGGSRRESQQRLVSWWARLRRAVALVHGVLVTKRGPSHWCMGSCSQNAGRTPGAWGLAHNITDAWGLVHEKSSPSSRDPRADCRRNRPWPLVRRGPAAWVRSLCADCDGAFPCKQEHARGYGSRTLRAKPRKPPQMRLPCAPLPGPLPHGEGECMLCGQQ
jgi:hypothetical protein